MDSDLAWVNGKSGRQSCRYADAFQRSIISEAIYHFISTVVFYLKDYFKSFVDSGGKLYCEQNSARANCYQLLNRSDIWPGELLEDIIYLFSPTDRSGR